MTPGRAGVDRRSALVATIGAVARPALGIDVPSDVCMSCLRAVATTADIASFVATVGGDHVLVKTLVPPMANPEHYEPRASDLGLIANADLVVKVGLGYDHWLDKLLEARRRRLPEEDDEGLVDASTGVPLLDVRGRDPFARDSHAHGLANPHYWLDPANATSITASIAAAIARRDPDALQDVIANRQRFLDELQRQMQRWTARLMPLHGTAVLAYHDSWPYFARRFRLNVVGFVEPREGVTPSVAHFASLISLARRSQVRAVLLRSNEPRRFAQTVADQLRVPLVQLAPSVGSVPQAGDYLRFVDHNVDTLARAIDAIRRG